MLTKRERAMPLQSWLRRLWPFPVVRAGRTENPRVGGSTPSQATNLQRLAGVVLGALVLHLQLAAHVGAAEATSGYLRAAAIDTGWMAGAAGLDLGSTRYALARCPGCYEAVPWMRSDAGAVATKAAATAAGMWACYELRRRGHEREAKWFRWGVVVLWSGLAVNAAIRAR